MLPWAQQRLRELLGGVEVAASSRSSSSTSPSSPSTFETGAEVETTGEAVVNSRKGKLIPAYELTLKGTWREVKNNEKSKRGDWEIYLADENQGEDPDVRTSVAPGAGEEGEDSARAFREAAKAVLVPKLRDFVKELAAGGGSGSGSGTAAAEEGRAGEEAAALAKKAAAAVAAKPSAAPAAAAPKPSAPAPAPSSSSKGGSGDAAATTTLKLTEKFYCRPSDLFEALTDPRKVMAFTRAPAEIEGPPFAAVGGRYSIFDGAVEATFAEGTDAESHRIELDWRFKEVRGEKRERRRKTKRTKKKTKKKKERKKERKLFTLTSSSLFQPPPPTTKQSQWPDASVSRVSISMREPSRGLTELSLEQTGIPVADRFGNGGSKEVAEAGWRGRIFGGIRGVFGYGLGL